MLYEIKDGTIFLGGEEILSHFDFEIHGKEKIAIIGSNGTGKTTLCRVLAGELEPETNEKRPDGGVSRSRSFSVGYLRQEAVKHPEWTVEQEKEELIRQILEKKQELYDRETALIERDFRAWFTAFGFRLDDMSRRLSDFSGGQQMRIAMIRQFLLQPEVLILDEPTNHLDEAGCDWLEQKVKDDPGCVVMVSHDRYFLDRIADKVIEVDGGRVTEYKGNYSAYAALKKRQREDALKAYMNQRQMIKHQEEVIEKLRSFNREKSIKRAESRQKMLDKVKRLDKPAGPEDKMVLKLSAHEESGKDVLVIEGLSKSFGSHTLFSDVNIHIRRGERVAIIGDNGTGKTTLLKIITGLTDADAGTLTLGSKVEIGYYDQEQQLLTDENTLFEEISNAYPDLTNTTIRNTLASFLFTGDDVFKPVSALSGGERGRLSLCKLILSDYNFLILDEPTNHLDMPSKEVLENALSSYEGTLLYVSHDRYFVNQTCTRILELSGGQFTEYLGNYDYYLEKKENMVRPEAASAGTAAQPETAAGALDWKQQKEEQARKRKTLNDIKKTEAAIEERESRSAEIDELLTHEDIFTNVSRLMELNSEKEKLQEELMELMEKWEELLSEE